MRTILKLCLVLSVLMLVSACVRAPSAPVAKSASAQAKDDYRFVVMSPAIAVMLRDLGFEDQIVGKHAWDMVLSDSVAIVGSESGVEYETMLRAEPTHIFFQRSSAGVPEKLKTVADEHGWVILTMPLDTLDDIAVGVDDLYMKFVGVREKNIGEVDPTIRFAEMTMPSESLAQAWADLGPVADKAGRVLVLGSIEPPGAMGPESFHFQLLDRLGATLAITDGGMWQELDFEDIVRLNPDSIILFSPRVSSESDLFAPVGIEESRAAAAFGKIGGLDINAVRFGRLAVIDDPLALLPSTSLGKVGEQVGDIFKRWGAESIEP